MKRFAFTLAVFVLMALNAQAGPFGLFKGGLFKKSKPVAKAAPAKPAAAAPAPAPKLTYSHTPSRVFTFRTSNSSCANGNCAK